MRVTGGKRREKERKGEVGIGEEGVVEEDKLD